MFRFVLNFRQAAPVDVDWLMELRMATMAGYIEASGTRLTHDQQKDRILQDFDAIRLIVSNDAPVGMIKVVRAADAWRLVQIQILPSHQRLGVGTRVIRNLMAEAGRAKVPLLLSVLKVNPAKALYDRLGFRTVSESERSYEMRADVLPEEGGFN